MRFDLTYAAFRVLDRASGERVPLSVLAEISAAKLLMALFGEEDCRAAQWLRDAGLSLGQFREAFDLDVIEARAMQQDFGGEGKFAELLMPISAPSFQVGNYGVPVDAYSVNAAAHQNSVNAVASSGNTNAPTNIAASTDPDGGSTGGQFLPKRRQQDEHDELTLNEGGESVPTSKRYYSLFAANSENSVPESPAIKSQNRRNHRFYVDDQPVLVAQLSSELEVAFESVGQLCRNRNVKNRKIPIANGGVRTIEADEGGDAAGQPIATEHLLLIVSMDDSDVGCWLSDHGFDSAGLSERIAVLNMPQQNLRNQFEQHLTDIDSGENQSLLSATILNNDTEHEAGLTQKIYRLIDAAANRGREAVRVIEDCARFILDDQVLTRKLKEFRHEFQIVLRPFVMRDRIAAREADADVGKTIEAEDEFCRDSVWGVIDVNFSRLQESLRSIEEFSKIEFVGVARRVERLRYRSYVLQKDFWSNGNSQNETNCPELSLGVSESRKTRLEDNAKNLTLEKTQLYVLISCMSDEAGFAEAVKGIIAGGADAIQLRDKNADDQKILSRSGVVRELVAGSGREVLFIMNDRPELAVLAGADGVHVGQDDTPVSKARQIVGERLLVGVSTHNIIQARKAVIDGADYIGAGAIFASETKNIESLAGIDFLKQVCAEIKIPVFAIGGIDADNIAEVIAAGSTRIAVSNAILNSKDIKLATENLHEKLIKKEP
jgi:thiamine-phosphate pyrophosphorylase